MSIMEGERRLAAEFKTAGQAPKVEYEGQKRRRGEERVEQQRKRMREEDGIAEDVSAASKKRQKVGSKLPKGFDIEMCWGKYRVTCPKLRENYGSERDDDYTLSLARLDSNTVYGQFDFGPYAGYLRSTKIDTKSGRIDLNWRGRETGNGESTFEPRNVFSITFVDKRLFEGSAKGSFFAGLRDPGQAGHPRLVRPRQCSCF